MSDLIQITFKMQLLPNAIYYVCITVYYIEIIVIVSVIVY